MPEQMVRTCFPDKSGINPAGTNARIKNIAINSHNSGENFLSMGGKLWGRHAPVNIIYKTIQTLKDVFVTKSPSSSLTVIPAQAGISSFDNREVREVFCMGLPMWMISAGNMRLTMTILPK